MTRVSSIWDTLSENKLATLWAHGISGAEIGRLMKRPKNAIIGKARRLKLTARPSPIVVCGPAGPNRVRPKQLCAEPKAAAAPASAAMFMVKSSPAPKPVFPPPARIALPSVVFLPRSPRQCDFPLWNGSERPTHLYCENDGVGGRGYCLAHHALTHVKAISRAESQGA